ncbi:MAG: beta-lactamase family protein [Catenulispora sp.]|nr:beta-lactamase family protein [Catenulispora sp.]
MSAGFERGTAPGEIVADAARRGVIPGAVLRYGRGPEGPVRGGEFGDGVSAGSSTAELVYDLASLTKVTATLPLALRLVETGELGLDDPVTKYLPRFAGAGVKDQMTVRQLLSHTSGLPAHREVWRLPGTAADRFAAVLAEPLESPPGTAVRYSDLGFILLGRIVADLTSQPLDAAFAELVAAPLGLASTGYRPADPAAAAATEANWFDDAARQDPKTGVVHDENAESLGGVAGHAGLFGTATDLAAYLRLGWLSPDSPILGADIRAEALRSQTAGLDGVRGLGWTLRGDSHDFMSDSWPPSGAGHTGFTGTSLAFDPRSGIWCVLLTNAVLLGRENRTRELRRALHAAVAAEYGITPVHGQDIAPDIETGAAAGGNRITA